MISLIDSVLLVIHEQLRKDFVVVVAKHLYSLERLIPKGKISISTVKSKLSKIFFQITMNTEGNLSNLPV